VFDEVKKLLQRVPTCSHAAALLVDLHVVREVFTARSKTQSRTGASRMFLDCDELNLFLAVVQKLRRSA